MVREHHRKLAAVVVEPLVQGAAGMSIAPAADFAELGKACHDTGVLLICDEVATGFGRTGTLFASEQCGLRPDLDVPGQGHHRRLSADVGDGRFAASVRCLPRSGPEREDAVSRPLVWRERARRRRRAQTFTADRVPARP